MNIKTLPGPPWLYNPFRGSSTKSDKNPQGAHKRSSFNLASKVIQQAVQARERKQQLGLESPSKAEDRSPALKELKRHKHSLTSEPRSERRDRNYKVFSRQKNPPILLKRPEKKTRTWFQATTQRLSSWCTTCKNHMDEEEWPQATGVLPPKPLF